MLSVSIFISILISVSVFFLFTKYMTRRRSKKNSGNSSEVQKKKKVSLLDTISFSQSFYISAILKKMKEVEYDDITEVKGRLKKTLQVLDEVVKGDEELHELKIELESCLDDPIRKWIISVTRVAFTFMLASLVEVNSIKELFSSEEWLSILVNILDGPLFLMIVVIVIWMSIEIIYSKTINKSKWVLNAVNYKLNKEK